MNSNFNKSVAEILGLSHHKAPTFSKEELTRLYASAYKLYHDAEYEKAKDLFLQLVLALPFNGAFWAGLASCEQMCKSYDAALRAWALAALTNPEDPLPHFHAAECYLSQGDKLEALKALNSAKSLISAESELKEKIENLKTACETHDSIQ